MENRQNKIIFLDIDGTLTVGGTNTPPPGALRAIRAAQAKGSLVFLCTGRNLAMLKPLLVYGFDGFIGSAGGYVCCGDELIYDHPMTKEQGEAAVEILRRNGVYCTLETRDATYGDDGIGDFLLSASGGNSELKRMRAALEKELNIVSGSLYRGEPIYKIVFVCREMGQLEEAKRLLEQEFRFICYEEKDRETGGTVIVNGELINRAFDKGRALLRVCEHYGISREDSVGFGDSLNDLEMIETAGIGVCMENGDPALRAVSSLVCPPVEKEGLAEAFSLLGLS